MFGDNVGYMWKSKMLASEQLGNEVKEEQTKVPMSPSIALSLAIRQLQPAPTIVHLSIATRQQCQIQLATPLCWPFLYPCMTISGISLYLGAKETLLGT